MAYRVRLSVRAAKDAERIYERVAEQAPLAGQTWYNALIATLYSLDTFPERGGVVESLSAPSSTVRKILYGHRPHVYAIYFEVAGDTVNILHIRHGARKEPTRREIFG